MTAPSVTGLFRRGIGIRMMAHALQSSMVLSLLNLQGVCLEKLFSRHTAAHKT
jgi:hypothetical protein